MRSGIIKAEDNNVFERSATMKYATLELQKEHDGILYGLLILESMVKDLRSGMEAEKDDACEMNQFFTLFADKCHHGKEEDLFFPALDKAGIGNSQVAQMLREHAEGRELMSRMAASAGGDVIGPDYPDAATRYIQLLRLHIQKENTILFPRADQGLPAEENLRLLQEFDVFEEDVMGRGMHEELHEMLGRLELKYL
jgi:hemerythrin-like domain-containing protein